MKKFLILMACALFTSMATTQENSAELLSQRPSLEIQKQFVSFQKESRSAYSMYVVAPVDDVSKAWKEYLADKYQLELKKMKDGLKGEQVSLADISADKLDFYSMIKEDENGARLDVLINKNGTFISPTDHPKETAALESMMQTFARNFYVKQYDSVLTDQRKEAEKLAKDYDKSVKEGEKLLKEATSLESDIAKAEQAIVDADKKIAELEAKKESLKGDISEAKAKIKDNAKAQNENKSTTVEKKNKSETHEKRITKLKSNADSFRTDQ